MTAGPNNEVIVGDIGGGSGGQVLFISDKITNDTADGGDQGPVPVLRHLMPATITNLSTRG